MWRQAPLLVFSVLVAVVVLAFYASVGLIIPRLALACLPPLLVATRAVALDASTGLEGARRQALSLAFLAIAVGQSVFMIVKDGPYS